MLDYENVPTRPHPVYVEVDLLVRIDLICDVGEHVGICNERVLIPHDPHDYLLPTIFVVLFLTFFYDLIDFELLLLFEFGEVQVFLSH